MAVQTLRDMIVRSLRCVFVILLFPNDGRMYVLFTGYVVVFRILQCHCVSRILIVTVTLCGYLEGKQCISRLYRQEREFRGLVDATGTIPDTRRYG